MRASQLRTQCPLQYHGDLSRGSCRADVYDVAETRGRVVLGPKYRVNVSPAKTPEKDLSGSGRGPNSPAAELVYTA